MNSDPKQCTTLYTIVGRSCAQCAQVARALGLRSVAMPPSPLARSRPKSSGRDTRQPALSRQRKPCCDTLYSTIVVFLSRHQKSCRDTQTVSSVSTPRIRSRLNFSPQCSTSIATSKFVSRPEKPQLFVAL